MKTMIISIHKILLIVCVCWNFLHVFGYNNNYKLNKFVWSEWSNWGHCSRSCDIGIQKRDRVCYDLQNPANKIPSHYCFGDAVEYKTCANKPCPKESIDFRSEQCERFNSRPHQGKFYKWKPFLDGAPLCDLLCMPEGVNMYQKLAEKVTDGTSCGYDFKGVCIDGQCKLMGCDGKLNSTKEYDKCGVCGGDNEACRLVSGLYMEEPSEIGYNTITIFPVGSRNINITEMEASENFLALRIENGPSIVNGESKIEYSGIFKAAGTDIFYYRRRIILNKDAGEGFFIKGPISEPIVLQILYQTHNPGVLYHYVQDIEPVGLIYPLDVHQPTTNFNNNQMNIKMHNNNNNNNTKMNRTKSKNSLILLPANASINENPIWNKDFTKSPLLSVNNPKHKTTPQLMHQTMLNNIKTPSNPSPNSYRAQMQAQIIPLFKQDSNGATDAPLVFTVKPDLPAKQIAHIERKKNNYFSNENSKQIITGQEKSVDESDQVFLFNKESNHKINESFIWISAGYTQCSQPCGEGVMYENIRCLNKSSGKITIESNCRSKSKPEQRNATCNDIPCPPKWYVSHWSECSVTCGIGIQHRGLKCKQRVSAEQTKDLPKDMCKNLKMPETQKTCKEKCTYWKISKWQNCQVTCGRGAKLRSVTCVNEMGLIVNDDQCYEPKPAIYEICDMGSCAKIWFYTDWSSTCNMYCESERSIKRRIVCGADATSANASLILANQSRNCDPSKIPEPSKKCTASISCIGSWFAGTWSECSAPCNRGERTRPVVCMKKEADKWIQTNPYNCNPIAQPLTTETCNTQPCKPEWFISDWNECSKSCGDGMRSREIKCIDQNNKASFECDIKMKPHFREFCNNKECPQAEQAPTKNDPECKDRLPQCYLIFKSNLCIYYKNDCCHSCKN